MLKAFMRRWAQRATPTPKLEPGAAWQLRPECDWSSFLLALRLLELQGGTVAFEGTTERHVTRWLSKHASSEGAPISAGTMWPASDWWYLPIEGPRIVELAVLMESAASVSIHLYAYDNTGLVIEWYDAFDEPLWISRRIDEGPLKRFVSAVGGSLETVGPSA